MRLSYKNLKLKHDLLSQQYEAIEKAYTDHATLYHDMEHHLQAIYHMAEEEGNKKIQEYIANLYTPVIHYNRLIWTHIGIVDSILNEKKELAASYGIELTIDAEVPYNSGIAEDDFCIILSNLLDNAIESTKHISIPQEEKMISISLRRIHQFLIISVKNPFHSTLIRRGPFWATTKTTHEELHGWGLKSVKSSVQKYQGKLTTSAENGIFCTTAILFFQR